MLLTIYSLFLQIHLNIKDSNVQKVVVNRIKTSILLKDIFIMSVVVKNHFLAASVAKSLLKKLT